MAEIEARKVQLHQILPDFVLTSIDGKRESIRAFKQKSNLVLIYLDLNKCPDCIDYLKELADNYHIYSGLETRILAVVPMSLSDLQSTVGNLGLPFPVLADEQGQVGNKYLADSPVPDPIGGVFIADRWGELRTMMYGRSKNDLPNQPSILDWLSLIETECPECGPGDEAFRKAMGEQI